MPKHILLTDKRCSACQSLKNRTKNTLPKDVKVVELFSQEGMALAKKAGVNAIPVVVEKSTHGVGICQIYEVGNRIVAKCPSGEKVLS